MHHSITRHIAIILLACFSLVFIHAIAPHSHFEAELETFGHHHDSDGNRHSHSGLSGILDFLNDLTHSEIGENHLEEFLNSSNKIPLSNVDVTGCDISKTIAQLIFQSNGLDVTKPIKLSLQQVFFENSPRRGPPSAS